MVVARIAHWPVFTAGALWALASELALTICLIVGLNVMVAGLRRILRAYNYRAWISGRR